ncbi:hypothetical protein FBY40_1310 [Microbacterium sp. SLBN-154]|uniref:DUF6194 family protein n=1 Tax=Microbacterium sp. SLBN-154 TaxID=2768458 RepID=UPI00114E03F3|nr:DUF6194 family protein [Microbacterium sp. SLBN-154]TQK18821.1 hypothetical protein FBY40_1310 [Microbacterium sp. SLBN-154]
MEIQEIVDAVRAFDGVLVVIPDEKSGLPELAWGDVFLSYAPDGVTPERSQPYATVVTKNYPDDEASELDEPGRFRVNIHVGREQVASLTDAAAHPAAADTFVRHPLYGDVGWVAVVNPGPKTSERVLMLLRDAHEAARARVIRRSKGS